MQESGCLNRKKKKKAFGEHTMAGCCLHLLMLLPLQALRKAASTLKKPNK